MNSLYLKLSFSLGSVSAKPEPIDWDFYAKNISKPGLVANFQKSVSNQIDLKFFSKYILLQPYSLKKHGYQEIYLLLTPYVRTIICSTACWYAKKYIYIYSRWVISCHSPWSKEESIPGCLVIVTGPNPPTRPFQTCWTWAIV